MNADVIFPKRGTLTRQPGRPTNDRYMMAGLTPRTRAEEQRVRYLKTSNPSASAMRHPHRCLQVSARFYDTAVGVRPGQHLVLLLRLTTECPLVAGCCRLLDSPVPWVLLLWHLAVRSAGTAAAALTCPPSHAYINLNTCMNIQVCVPSHHAEGQPGHGKRQESRLRCCTHPCTRLDAGRAGEIDRQQEGNCDVTQDKLPLVLLAQPCQNAGHLALEKALQPLCEQQ